MPVCKGCQQERSDDDFYRHAAMANGRLSFCKECVKARVGKHRAANLESIQAYDRERGLLQHRKEKVKIYAKTHPEVVNKLSRENGANAIQRSEMRSA